MKKIYLLMVVGLMASFANAQHDNIQTREGLSVAEPEVSPQRYTPSGQRATTHWSENWLVASQSGNDIISLAGTWTSSGPDHLWAPDTDGPDGYYSNTVADLASTSGTQWIIFDAGASHPTNPLPTYPDRAGTLTSPTISALNGLTDTVYLRVEHRHRFCCDGSTMEIKVEVTNNGGVTWYSYDLLEGSGVNDGVPNPTVSTVALCDVPGPWTSNVQIRFTWGGTGNSHYYWMIDDIELYSSDPNDLSMSQTFHGVHWNGGAVQSFDFEIYPLNEVRPIRLGAVGKNIGANEQADVILDVTVTDPSAGVNTYSSTPTSWPNCDFKDTLYVDGLTPSEVGRYHLDYWIRNGLVTDIDTSNNSGYMNIDVSDSIFARDFGVYSNNGSYGAFSDPNDVGITAIVGNQFTFVGGNNAHVKGARVAIDNNTHAGNIIWASIWEFPSTAQNFNDDWQFIADGVEHTIVQAEISDDPQEGGEPIWVDLLFETPVPVPNTTSRYMVGVAIPAPPDTVRIPTSGVAWDNGGALYGDLNGNGEQFFSAFNSGPFDAPMVRAIMDYSTGLEEVDLMGFDLSDNFPNPFTDRTAYTLTLNSSSPVSYQVTDISGKVVFEEDLGNMSPGRHQIFVDGRHLESGIYSFQLHVGDGWVGKKMMHTKE